ncbi:MAG: hypothetical protein ACYTXA_00695 [Nostoc sp.]
MSNSLFLALFSNETLRVGGSLSKSWRTWFTSAVGGFPTGSDW